MGQTIYVLSAEGMFFYVGRTGRLIQQRLKEHISEAMDSRRVCNTPKARLIRQLVMDGIEIKIEMLEENADEDREYYWVDKLKFEGRGLLNSKNGDQGKPLTSDQRKELRWEIQQFKKKNKKSKKKNSAEEVAERQKAMKDYIVKSNADHQLLKSTYTGK